MATQNKLSAAVKAEIVKRNKAFTKANMQRRRVLIAKDIIAQIKAGKIVADEGHWYQNYRYDVDLDDNMQAKFLSDNGQQCSCCALGAVMVSCTLFKNNVKYKDAANLFDVPDVITEGVEDIHNITTIFGIDQLKKIECAYERGNGYFRNGWDAVNFGRRYDDPEKRMIAIMENIIKNKGTFIP